MKRLLSVILVLAMVMMLFASCNSTLSNIPCDLTELLDVHIKGYDKTGKLEIEILKDKLDEMVFGQDGLTVEKALKKPNAFMISYYKFKSSLTYETNMEENLKNGDKINLFVKYDQDLAKELGLNITSNQRVMKIDGLQKAEEVDPFDEKAFKARFDGISPFATLVVSADISANPILQNVKYTYDEQKVYKYGDDAVINAELVDDEDGKYVLSRKTIKVMCTDVSRYVNSVYSLSEEDEKYIFDFCFAEEQKIIEKYANHAYKDISDDEVLISLGEGLDITKGSISTVDNLTIDSVYLMTAIEEGLNDYNAYMVAVSADYTSEKYTEEDGVKGGFAGTTKLYSYYLFTNIVVDSEDVLDREVIHFEESDSLRAFKLEDLLADTVDKVKEKYKVEDKSVKLVFQKTDAT